MLHLVKMASWSVIDGCLLYTLAPRTGCFSPVCDFVGFFNLQEMPREWSVSHYLSIFEILPWPPGWANVRSKYLVLERTKWAIMSYSRCWLVLTEMNKMALFRKKFYNSEFKSWCVDASASTHQLFSGFRRAKTASFCLKFNSLSFGIVGDSIRRLERELLPKNGGKVRFWLRTRLPGPWHWKG